MTKKVEKIKQLRAETSAGIMEIKKALDDAKGDFDRAKELLYERGIAKAASKDERNVSAGIIHSYLHGGKIGVLVEVKCETDFVARTEIFKDLVHELAMQIAAMKPESLEVLMGQDYIKDTSKKIDELIKSVVASTGENIVVGRFIRYALDDTN